MEEFIPILYPEYGFSSPHKQKRHNISKIAPDSGPLIGSCGIQKSFIGSGNGMDGNTLGSVNKKVSALSNNGLEGLANFDIGYGSGSPISAEKRRSSEKGGIERGIGNAGTPKRGTNLHILDQLSESGFGMFKKSVPSPAKSGTLKSEDTDPDSKVLPQQPITSSPGSASKFRSCTIQPDTKGTDSSKYKVAPVEISKQQPQDRGFSNSSQNAGKSIPSNIETERISVSKAYNGLDRSGSRRGDIQHRNIETAEKACQTCPEELSQSIGVQTNTPEQSNRSNTYNACSSSSFSPKVSEGPSVRINSHHSSVKKDGMSNKSWLMVHDIRLMTQPSTGSPPSRSPPTAGITKDEQLKPSKRHIYQAIGKEKLPESPRQPQAQSEIGTFSSVKEQIQDVSNATAAMMEAVDRAEAKLKSKQTSRKGFEPKPDEQLRPSSPRQRHINVHPIKKEPVEDLKLPFEGFEPKPDEQLRPSSPWQRHVNVQPIKKEAVEDLKLPSQPRSRTEVCDFPAAEEEQIQGISNASAAMMEAVDRAEAKLKSARERREGKGTVPMQKGKEANPTSRKEENREVRDGKKGDGKRVDSDTHVDIVGSDKEAVERASHELRERALKKAAERAAVEAQEKLRAASVRAAEDEKEHQKMHVKVGRQSRDASTREKNLSLNRAEGHCSEVQSGNQIGGNPISGTAQSESEPSEGRETKFGKQHRHLERAAKALEEKNERDMNAQHEQEERIRASEMLDGNIRQWAAGKEGNMRALLSTLHQILWAECGWQPVLLSDLFSGSDVKKAYRKATLCLHPDKVQQKGATLHQKYIAEKVFNLLKDAWKKFESTELF